MNKIQHIIFDLDGTLIDSADSVIRCFEQILKLNLLLPIIQINKNILGPPLIDALRILTGSENLELLNKLSDDFKRIYDKDGYKISTVYPDIENVLNFLFNARISLYIVTNKRILPTRKIINYLGWNRYFEGIYSIDSFDHSSINTKTAVLTKTIILHSIPINNAFYVGDRAEDEQAALDCGLKFIGVTWGSGNWDNQISNYTRLITNPKDLVKIINNN